MAQQPITLGDLERNPELLNQFIAENTRLLIQHCVRNFRKINEQDAEELVHDVFVKLIEIVTEGEVEKKGVRAIAWMHQELGWRCIDRMREKERVIFGEEGENVEERENIIDSLPDPTISIEDEIIRREDELIRRRIYKFLRECIQTKMKRRRRQIFEFYLKGYIAAEIARELGVTRAFVAKETKIGCQNLRKWLTEHGFDADSIRDLLSSA